MGQNAREKEKKESGETMTVMRVRCRRGEARRLGGYKSGVDPVISGVDGAWIFRRWSVDFPSMERGFSVDGAMVASVCIGI